MAFAPRAVVGGLVKKVCSTGDPRTTAPRQAAPHPHRTHPAVWVPSGASFLWQLPPLSPWLPSRSLSLLALLRIICWARGKWAGLALRRPRWPAGLRSAPSARADLCQLQVSTEDGLFSQAQVLLEARDTGRVKNKRKYSKQAEQNLGSLGVVVVPGRFVFMAGGRKLCFWSSGELCAVGRPSGPAPPGVQPPAGPPFLIQLSRAHGVCFCHIGFT